MVADCLGSRGSASAFSPGRAASRAVLLRNVGLEGAQRGTADLFAALAEVKAERAKGNKQAKLRVHKPKPKRRHHDQAIRFTANSRFRVLANGRLRLPKVGDLRVRWSRQLPSTPSSVTITLDGAGRYHASFVVRVQEAPLPSIPAQVGIDLGLIHFATLSTGEKVANPAGSDSGRRPCAGPSDR